MHIGSYDKMADFVAKYLGPKADQPLRILELGSCDVNGTHRSLFFSPTWTYVGADMGPGRNVDVVLKDPYKWTEFADESFDAVVSGSVFEHIEFPWLTIVEIARVLKPRGMTCNIAPSAGFEHRFPVDCYRYYPDGMQALCKWAKLEPVDIWTDWHTDSSKDGGHIWKDTVMIARKSG
jgi:SAM-dependent methyltransferase